MGKKRQQAEQKKVPVKTSTPLDPQQRTAEFLTVGWMLTTLATLAAEVVGLLAAIPLYWSDVDWPAALLALPGLMLAVACLSGAVGLILCAVASRTRQDPAPSTITRGSIFICILPWLVISARWLAG
ncbi:MAG: hypothetical protein OSB47_04055 [Pirellulaceae bacterium]|nr:hypothetical protein [Pirellulaceae bacterium]